MVFSSDNLNHADGVFFPRLRPVARLRTAADVGEIAGHGSDQVLALYCRSNDQLGRVCRRYARQDDRVQRRSQQMRSRVFAR